LKKLIIKFIPENEEAIELLENIKNFGEIFNEENNEFEFKFKQGNNYNTSNNGLIALKDGNNGWNCVIVGDKEIPKDKISKWKIKINKDKTVKGNIDIFIGIGPKIFNRNLYDECWSIYSNNNDSIIKLQLKDKDLNYNNHKEKLKEGDIIQVIVDRKKGNLSFAVNDVDFGIACSTIPKEDELFPTVVLYEKGLKVEIIKNI
jgi:hypothetical protein